jgi:Ca2+:H+ antiporter
MESSKAFPPRKRIFWAAMPVVAAIVAVLSLLMGDGIKSVPGMQGVWLTVEMVVLIAAVFVSVHHADVIAHRTGEPFGTLVLTVAVTVIEVSLILSVMLSGDDSAGLVRDTVFSVIMIVCNGIVGICLIVGGLRYGEQGFRLPGANAYLVVLMPLATLTLILPNYTTSAAGPYYSGLQLGFVSIVTLILYGVFLYVQTVRHRDYFLSDAGDLGLPEDQAMPSNRKVWISAILLLIALAGIVLLAKSFSGSVKSTVVALGAPASAMGLLVALLVLLPESLAAVKSARHNELQKSLNLALGSTLATIGLTIPAVGALTIWLGQPLALGLSMSDTVLIAVTFAVSLVTFGGGRTNILPGFVHLLLFAVFVFLVFAP